MFNELLNRTFSKYFFFFFLLCPIFLHIPCYSKQEILHNIVPPVYKETGELMRDILLKLMLADLEPV